jgi:hypothetical protein
VSWCGWMWWYWVWWWSIGGCGEGGVVLVPVRKQQRQHWPSYPIVVWSFSMPPPRHGRASLISNSDGEALITSDSPCLASSALKAAVGPSLHLLCPGTAIRTLSSLPPPSKPPKTTMATLAIVLCHCLSPLSTSSALETADDDDGNAGCRALLSSRPWHCHG